MDETRCIIFERPANSEAAEERRGWVVERPIDDQPVWEVTSPDGGVTCYFPSKTLAVEYAEFKAHLRSIPIPSRHHAAAVAERDKLYKTMNIPPAIQERLAELYMEVQGKLAEADYGKLLAEQGITTVALNEDGEITEHQPDGTSTPLQKP